ncbi:hypothetical protein A2U01_0100455, partial [Trifolium medium]|nr:hypothetical protein [Trifolium medium]
PNGEIQEWTVLSRKGGHREDGRRDIRFGAGWYKYAMNVGFAKGDSIGFYTTNNDKVLKVKVIRNVA